MSRRTLTQREAEQEARKLLAEASVAGPPVDVDALARIAGAEVRRRPNSPDISGLLYRQDDDLIIGVNADDSPARQRFTIAHEIGHLRLHKSGFFVDRAYRASRENLPSDPDEERQANWFAAELLMPETMITTVARNVVDQRSVTDDALIGALAERFNVSRQAMGFRLLNLGVVNGL
jgi:Zn-dependent peptidase ImmA (M78 family)